jgi:Carboxypeptidase regulatory-like domain
VRFAGLTAEATIFVLSKGTFRLAGRITEGGRGLENVTLTVIAGVGEGLTAHTDASGAYELYGVAGPVQVRASKDGYLNTAQEVDVTAHGSLTFELMADQLSDDYTGAYTLTLNAGGCTPGFPEAAKRRVYAARVVQTGANLRVSLSGANFWAGSGAFAAVIAPTGEIRFTIRPESVWDYDATDLIEHLSDGDSLIVGGVVIARHTPAGILGNGGDANNSGNGGYMRLNLGRGICRIDRFEMVRRFSGDNAESSE